MRKLRFIELIGRIHTSFLIQWSSESQEKRIFHAATLIHQIRYFDQWKSYSGSRGISSLETRLWTVLTLRRSRRLNDPAEQRVKNKTRNFIIFWFLVHADSSLYHLSLTGPYVNCMKGTRTECAASPILSLKNSHTVYYAFVTPHILTTICSNNSLWFYSEEIFEASTVAPISSRVHQASVYWEGFNVEFLVKNQF